MTLLLDLLKPRLAKVDQILYSAHDEDDFDNSVVYEASVKPGDFAKDNLEYSSAADFVKANKRVLRDTASGKSWEWRQK